MCIFMVDKYVLCTSQINGFPYIPGLYVLFLITTILTYSLKILE